MVSPTTTTAAVPVHGQLCPPYARRSLSRGKPHCIQRTGVSGTTPAVAPGVCRGQTPLRSGGGRRRCQRWRADHQLPDLDRQWRHQHRRHLPMQSLKRHPPLVTCPSCRRITRTLASRVERCTTTVSARSTPPALAMWSEPQTGQTDPITTSDPGAPTTVLRWHRGLVPILTIR